VLWALGAVVYLAASRRWRAREALWAAMVPLAVGLLCAVQLQSLDVPDPWILFLSARFITGLCVVAVGFWASAVLYREREWLDGDGRTLRRFLLWSALVLLLAHLSAEPCRWCLHEITDDPRRARWLAQMSVSITWALYAAAVLWAGFWKRRRPIRFAALALFALTAAKLAFIDLAGIEQIYRILSFFILGVLMIASAYLYHKAEGALKDTAEAEPPKAEG
jgi:uncharacterized membrane protein